MTDRQLRSCLLHDTNSTSTRKAHYNISRYELQEEILYSCDRLPLHRACASKPPVEVVKALLDIYPEAIKYREKYGATVLHISVQNKASSHVVSFLIQRWKVRLFFFFLLPSSFFHLTSLKYFKFVLFQELFLFRFSLKMVFHLYCVLYTTTMYNYNS